MGPEALWSPFCFSSLSSEQEKAQEALRESGQNDWHGVKACQKQPWRGKRPREKCGVPVHREAPGRPLSRQGQLHSLPPSFLCVDCLVLRTGRPGRFRSG